MIALKIIGIILAVLAALIAVLLMLSVDILLQASSEKGFQVLFRIFGKIFGDEPKKEKEKKTPENPLVKGLKKTLGISHLGDFKTIRSTVEEHGAAVTLSETVSTVMLLLNRILWLLKRSRIPTCRIVSVSGGEDAAIDYGIACAALYPLAGYLQATARACKPQLDLRCDYEQPKGTFDLKLVIRVRVLHVMRVFLHMMKKNIEKEVLQAAEPQKKGS